MSGSEDRRSRVQGGEDPAPRGSRRDGAIPRATSDYHRYRYIGHLVDRMLRAQEEKMCTAQTTLDAVLAKNQRALIEAERRLWKSGHLNEEPPQRTFG